MMETRYSSASASDDGIENSVAKLHGKKRKVVRSVGSGSDSISKTLRRDAAKPPKVKVSVVKALPGASAGLNPGRGGGNLPLASSVLELLCHWCFCCFLKIIECLQCMYAVGSPFYAANCLSPGNGYGRTTRVGRVQTVLAHDAAGDDAWQHGDVRVHHVGDADPAVHDAVGARAGAADAPARPAPSAGGRRRRRESRAADGRWRASILKCWEGSTSFFEGGVPL